MKRPFRLVALVLLLVAEGFLLSAWLERAKLGRDDRRKSDLATIKTAFDRFWQDHTCYPALSSLSVCGSRDLSPYLATVPCDPQTGKPYRYLALDGDVCKGYRILTKLENTKDPEVLPLGEYNYGVAEGTNIVPQ